MIKKRKVNNKSSILPEESEKLYLSPNSISLRFKPLGLHGANAKPSNQTEYQDIHREAMKHKLNEKEEGAGIIARGYLDFRSSKRNT